MNRRRFLIHSAALGAGALSGLLSPSTALAAKGNASRFHAFLNARGVQSRTLWLNRAQTGEQIRVAYANNNTLLRDGYLKCCILMRDVRANKVAPIDVRLLDILSALQAWLALRGAAKPITVLSGYRTAETNARLEGAAQRSMHLEGRAADIRIKGISIERLVKLALVLEEGGVGIYRQSDFLHVDTGRIRTWGGA